MQPYKADNLVWCYVTKSDIDGQGRKKRLATLGGLSHATGEIKSRKTGLSHATGGIKSRKTMSSDLIKNFALNFRARSGYLASRKQFRDLSFRKIPASWRGISLKSGAE